MTVGFFYTDVALQGQAIEAFHVVRPSADTDLPATMVRSVQRAMPGVEIVQFTQDLRSLVPGITRIERRPTLPVAFALAEYKAQCAGDWLFLDSDILVRRDVRDVFNRAFDVAVATREGTMQPHEIGSRFMARNPYNAGVVFSRSQAFWIDVVERARTMSIGRQRWGCDQESMAAAIRTGTYRVHVLSNAYNYPPHTKDEDVHDKAILHLKGKRKQWTSRFAA